MAKITPVRRIGIQTRSVAGRRPNGNQFESTLERDFLILAEWDEDVAQVVPQPIRIAISDPAAGRRSYTPDVLLVRRAHKPKLVEVKPRKAFAGQWRKWRAIARAASDFAHDRGWTFAFATEADIRTPRLVNATFLLPYRRDQAEGLLSNAILARVRELDRPTPHRVVTDLAGSLEQRADLLRTFWSLVATRRIAFHEDLALGMSSRVWLREAV